MLFLCFPSQSLHQSIICHRLSIITHPSVLIHTFLSLLLSLLLFFLLFSFFFLFFSFFSFHLFSSLFFFSLLFSSPFFSPLSSLLSSLFSFPPLVSSLPTPHHIREEEEVSPHHPSAHTETCPPLAVVPPPRMHQVQVLG